MVIYCDLLKLSVLRWNCHLKCTMLDFELVRATLITPDQSRADLFFLLKLMLK